MADGAHGGPSVIELWAWRHPRPFGAAGHCIGRTDLSVDPRRTRRLAHRIESVVRDAGLPREVWTSPLARCADVGRLLARRGFAHRVDARLAELDFGAWDGQPWNAIGAEEFAKWEADFSGHRPGGGESLESLMQRASVFLGDRACGRGAACTTAAAPFRLGQAVANPAADPVLTIGHAGWINAVRMLGQPVHTARWPAPIAYGALLRLHVRIAGTSAAGSDPPTSSELTPRRRGEAC